MRHVAVLVVLATVLGACALAEDPLAGRRSCWDLEDGETFGNTRELGADVVLFSRPGRYTPEEAAAQLEALGLEGEPVHAQRTDGPCGEQDVFVEIGDGEACATVVARDWWDHVCQSIGDPPEIDLDLGDVDGHAVLVLSLGETAHIEAESGGLLLAAFNMGGVGLITSPEPIGPVSQVAVDGTVLRTG